MRGVEESQHLERVNTYRCTIYGGWTVSNGQSKIVGSPLFLTGLTQYVIEHVTLSTWYHVGRQVQFLSIH